MIRIRYFLLIVLLGIAANVFSQQEVDLFIWAGQSNAQGWAGDAQFYPADTDHSDSLIKFNWTFIDNSRSDGWVTMQPQTGRFPEGHFGAEVSFGRKAKQAGYSPAIFKFTKGATSIYSDWKRPGEGGYYDQMITEVQKAIDELKNQGYDVKIKAFVWIQGESDADKPENAKAYRENLLSLIEHLRSKVVKDNSLPVILGVDEQHPWVVENYEVVDAQQRIAEKDNKIVFTSMIGLPKADATHLTPVGLVEHGERIFRAFESL